MEEAKWHPSLQGVMVQGKSLIFPVSWLSKQAYCEYKIFLENVKGIKVWETKAMVTGTKKHEELFKEHKERVTEEGTVQQFMDRAKKEKASFVLRELRVIAPETGLHGSIDEVVINPDSIEIIDDKPGDRAWPGNVRQIWGYCLAFRECHSPDRAVKGTMRNRDSRERVWTEILNKEHEQAMDDVISRVKGILKEEREAEPTANSSKCGKCRFHTQGKCDKSLALKGQG